MGYDGKIIKTVIKEIEESKIYLPALQRKFVWGKDQIEVLFDSIMRNYPIGTFLFWKLKREKANTYVFYEFLKEYDERTPYNKRKIGSFLHPEITGVLDGQQRLSSIYIGLQGTHTEKKPYKRRSSHDAYIKTWLYLNILSLPYKLSPENSIITKEDQNFEFRFLSQQDAKTHKIRKVKYIDESGNESESEEYVFWFKVGDVLAWDEDPEFDVIIDRFISACSEEKQKMSITEKKRFIKKALETLRARITKEEIINFFEISKDDLEDILKIFVRVNSGGTTLSKADLLFSTIVATWDNGREEIEALITEINEKGDKFNFTNEYLMRSCLVLSDAPVLYKVNSFKSENVERIKNYWPKIANAIRRTVDLLVEFGFNGSLLTSQNATIVIAYYILKSGSINPKTKAEIKKYLIHVLLNGVYGSTQDQVITALRNVLRIKKSNSADSNGFVLKSTEFSFDELAKTVLPARKSLYVTESELDSLLEYKKGASSFFVLSLLYPNLRYMEISFHQDHIHPFSRFTDDVFQHIGVSKEDRATWLNWRDMVPNLQLMEGRQNESKNALPFDEWLNAIYPDTSAHTSFCTTNFIPTDVSFEFSEFKQFFEKRKQRLRTELKNVLALTTEKSALSDILVYEDDDLGNTMLIKGEDE